MKHGSSKHLTVQERCTTSWEIMDQRCHGLKLFGLKDISQNTWLSFGLFTKQMSHTRQANLLGALHRSELPAMQPRSSWKHKSLFLIATSLNLCGGDCASDFGYRGLLACGITFYKLSPPSQDRITTGSSPLWLGRPWFTKLGERNDRLHRNTLINPDLIDVTIQNRISSLRHQNPAKASTRLHLWFSLEWSAHFLRRRKTRPLLFQLLGLY